LLLLLWCVSHGYAVQHNLLQLLIEALRCQQINQRPVIKGILGITRQHTTPQQTMV
jgi:hypothetical protein